MQTLTAPTITWQQIGFWTKAELGAKQPVALDDYTLRFKTTNFRGLQIVVRLTPMDVYDIDVVNSRGRVIETRTGIYADQLNPTLVDIAVTQAERMGL